MCNFVHFLLLFCMRSGEAQVADYLAAGLDADGNTPADALFQDLNQLFHGNNNASQEQQQQQQDNPLYFLSSSPPPPPPPPPPPAAATPPAAPFRGAAAVPSRPLAISTSNGGSDTDPRDGRPRRRR